MQRIPRFAFMVLAAAACVEEATVPTVGAPLVSLAVTPSATVLLPGEIDTIQVTITNTLQDGEVQLIFPTACQVLIYIRDSRGRVVLPDGGSYNCAPVPSQLLITAGAPISRFFHWNGSAELGTESTSARLPAGRYYVSAEMRGDGFTTIGFPILVTLLD